MTDIFGRLAGLMGWLGDRAGAILMPANGSSDLLAPMLAGAVAAVVVAIVIALYLRSGFGFRSSRDVRRTGLAALAALGLLAVAAADMRHAASAHSGAYAPKPAVPFESHLPTITALGEPTCDGVWYGAAPDHKPDNTSATVIA